MAELDAASSTWGAEVCRVCEAKLKIVDRNNQVVPLRPNAQQSSVLYWAGLQLAANLPVRIQTLKARRVGVSTICTAMAYLLARAIPHFPALTLAHDQQGTDTMRGISDVMHQHYPEAERLPTTYYNRGEIVYSHPHGSGVRFRTAGGSSGRKGAARSREVSYLHVSEEAWIDAADELFTGILPAVAERPGTFVVEESTAAGASGEFYDRWGRALYFKDVREPADLARRIGLFFSWLDFPEYRRPLTPGASLGALDADELELRRLGADDEQLNWRRFVLAEWFGGDVDRLRQEFPATPEEAFIHSGRPAIPAAIVEHHAESVCEPEQVVRLIWRHDRVEVVEAQERQGVWQVFQPPQRGHTYAIGADVSKGLLADPANPRSEPDLHAAWVLDRLRKRLVALWHGRGDTDLFGQAVLGAGQWYGAAWIAVDLTGGYGLAVLSELRNYAHLYLRPVPRDAVADHEELARYGVTITTANRDLLIDQYIAACREDPATGWDRRIWVPSLALVEEERTFEVTGKGKREHRRGAHDDVLWAAILAVEADIRCPAGKPMGAPEEEQAAEAVKQAGLEALLRIGALDPGIGHAEDEVETWSP